MGKLMGDSKKDLKQRKAVVEVLANIHSKESVDILLNELEKRRSDLDTEVINSLDKIRSEKPNIYFRPRVVKRKTFLLIKKHCRIFIELQELNPAKKNKELREKMRKELSISLINIFKLLGLYYPHVDIVKAYQNIKTGTKHSIAYAIELLDNILKKDIRDFVLPLIEEYSQPNKIKKFRQLLRNLPK
jgi:HEAT repeat protein